MLRSRKEAYREEKENREEGGRLEDWEAGKGLALKDDSESKVSQ